MKTVFIRDLQPDMPTTLFCWISNRRTSKNEVFFDIYDSTGCIQAVASRSQCADFELLTKLRRESAVAFTGSLSIDGDFVLSSYRVLANATAEISPSPNEGYFDVLAKQHERQVIEHPTFYIRNHQLRAIYYIKSVFKREIQDYFWSRNFVEFESPTLTKQTLYDDSGAIWLDVEHQNISLSRCATFHLEPAAIAYEKVFTITNSHADEKVKTNRHLVEYLHLKAEMCWVDLDELIALAADMYYEVSLSTFKKCKDQFGLIISEDDVLKKLNTLNPKNHKMITYDEAVEILRNYDIPFEYGKSLTSKQEALLTEHFGNRFLWVKYIPYTVEGFMFKRKEDNSFLTMTCDLIAPDGFGEILGCAEKMTDYNDLISSMKEKGKFCDYSRYEDYALLHSYGLPQHGGIGMGIERALRFLLGVSHVKYVKPFAVVKGTQIHH